MADPRMLDRDGVAAYLGCSPAHVDKLVADHIIPAPHRLGARLLRWDRRALDATLDRMSGLGGASDASDAEAELMRRTEAWSQ